MMEEYVVLDESDKGLQMKLNQWRHDYHIEIMAACLTSNGYWKVVLKRTKKEEE